MSPLLLNLLFVLTFFVRSSECTFDEEFNDNHWQSVSRDVFTDKGQKLSQLQTLMHLKYLQNVFEYIEEKKPQQLTHSLKQMATKTVDMIELSKVGVKKCRKTYMILFNTLLKEPKNSKNLKNYINYFWQQQLIICSLVGSKDMKMKVASMREKDKIRMEYLREKVDKAISLSGGENIRYSSLTLEILKQGVLPFFEETLGSCYAEEIAGKKNLIEQELGVVVGDLCFNVRGELSPTIDLLEHAIEYEIEVDAFTKYWLDNMQICESFQTKKKSLAKEIFKSLEEKYAQPKPVHQKIIDFITGGCLLVD